MDFYSSSREPQLSLEGKSSFFYGTFNDPLCKLNLTETSEFVKSLPSKGAIIQRRVEASSTPGRPVFSFSGGNLSRKSVPSKWDNAEKWLIGSSDHDSPVFNPSELFKMPKQCDYSIFAEKSRVTDEKFSSFQGALDMVQHCNPVSDSTDVVLKDKFTDNVQSVVPNLRYSVQSNQGFPFRSSAGGTMKNAGTEVVHEVQHKDAGTEMTPLGSSKTSRCHTPFKSSSPARHNTPINMSGPLATEKSSCTQLHEWNLAKLQIGKQYDSIVSNWSSREEEEEEVSKSLRHFETPDDGCHYSVLESRATAREDEEKTKSCLRYQRAEAKIQAWLNLQNAKAEAQSRKLEVKIQKMRSNLEEKQMKRMATVHRKAEEWRREAMEQHSDQIQRNTTQQHVKKSHLPVFISSCGCFPCTNNHH